jgi:hypothetical protein
VSLFFSLLFFFFSLFPWQGVTCDIDRVVVTKCLKLSSYLFLSEWLHVVFHRYSDAVVIFKLVFYAT